MTIRNEPCLSTAQLSEIIPRLPDNIKVQRLMIEACRICEKDIRRPETTMFETKQTYPNLYIPPQRLTFSTPLWNYAPRADKSNLWEDFLKEKESVDNLCRKFHFKKTNPELTDIPISDRLYIKEIILLELPIDNPNYHEGPYYPQQTDDKFYDGVRCVFAKFTGAYQLVGHAIEEERDGWLPGMTRKPMDLEEIVVVTTKHIRGGKKKRNWKAFHSGKDDTHTVNKDSLVNHPETVKRWLPTLLKAGLIIWREVEGDWRPSKKFVASRISLRATLGEEENNETEET